MHSTQLVRKSTDNRPLIFPIPLESALNFIVGIQHAQRSRSSLTKKFANFIVRLAALVPKPRVNLTRYRGVLFLCGPIQSPLARAGYTGQTRQRCETNRQHAMPHLNRASCRHDLGTTAQASVPYRHRGLRPLRWICSSHLLY